MSELKLRGVNLGGWLVLERWMTPSLFEGTEARDEYSLMQEPGLAERVERHRSEFITEEDFVWLANNGVNAVRIPVGYWIFDGDGPLAGCVSYLDWAVAAAERYGLKVLLDLHGAPGSQNGKDHSGRIGEAGWHLNSKHREDTIATLVRLAKRYKDSPAIWGIELLNEPKVTPLNFFGLRGFYNKAYRQLTKVARPGTHIVFSDGFLPRLFSGTIRPIRGYPVVMDIHWYQFGYVEFGAYFSTLAKRARQINALQRRQPVIVGEWSGMLSHQTLEGFSAEEKSRLRGRHIDSQLKMYRGAVGWFYWTYKTEKSGSWNFRWLVDNGILLLD